MMKKAKAPKVSSVDDVKPDLDNDIYHDDADGDDDKSRDFVKEEDGDYTPVMMTGHSIDDSIILAPLEETPEKQMENKEVEVSHYKLHPESQLVLLFLMSIPQLDEGWDVHELILVSNQSI